MHDFDESLGAINMHKIPNFLVGAYAECRERFVLSIEYCMRHCKFFTEQKIDGNAFNLY